MPDTIERDNKGQFAPGNRGGPGRPRGAVSRGAVALDEMGVEAGKRVFQVMLNKALAGDMRAADLLLSRIWPARRGRPVAIDGAPLKELADYVGAAAGVANAVMQGEMTPHEGQAVSRMLDTQLRAIDSAELERRVLVIERRLDGEPEPETGSHPFPRPYPADSRTVFDGFSDGPEDEKA